MVTLRRQRPNTQIKLTAYGGSLFATFGLNAARRIATHVGAASSAGYPAHALAIAARSLSISSASAVSVVICTAGHPPGPWSASSLRTSATSGSNGVGEVGPSGARSATSTNTSNCSE